MSTPKWLTRERSDILVRLDRSMEGHKFSDVIETGKFTFEGKKYRILQRMTYHDLAQSLKDHWIAIDREMADYTQDPPNQAGEVFSGFDTRKGWRLDPIERMEYHAHAPSFIEGDKGISCKGLPFVDIRVPSTRQHLYVDLPSLSGKARRSMRHSARRAAKRGASIDSPCTRAVADYWQTLP
jgi:hypothetical protein